LVSKMISLDAMGGDHGPEVVVPAALQVLEHHEDAAVIFVGREEAIKPLLDNPNAEKCADRWSIHHAEEIVAMDESPSQALRTKKDSSMRVAINLVKEGRAQACVSAGNTGALMATARFVLKTLPGIDRPAIITRFPTVDGGVVRLLDIGANVDCNAEHLYQFAVMGTVLARAVEGIDNPTVGLLNIGEEEIKGNELVKGAAELLQQSDVVNYIGYVEGDDIFKGTSDVVVCDGFVGNVVLKSCEGLLKFIGTIMKAAFKKDIYSQLAAIPATPVLKRLKKTIDPRQHNGATFIGLDGIVIKSHGGADELAYTSAIEEAFLEVEKNIPQQIRQRVEHLLSKDQATTSD